LRATERNIRIFVTDFIQLADDYSGRPIKTLYDRAALIALPEDMRGPYVAACRKFLTPSHQGLLVTCEFDAEFMQGPPFSVTPGEVERLWRGQLGLIERVNVLAEMPRAVALGVPRLDEYFWVFG
jgi:thiopurine S-methyltransferase